LDLQREIEISAHDFSRGKTILKIIPTVSTVYSLNRAPKTVETVGFV